MPLKGIPRLVSPELLAILGRMGHGDELLISDANFPSHGQGIRELVHCDGSSATDVLSAVLKLMPLDSFEPFQATVMKQVDSDLDAPVIGEFQKILDDAYSEDGSLSPVKIERVERFQFYVRAKRAFAICVTGEARLYGNIIIKKGVIGSDGKTVILETSSTTSAGGETKKLKMLDPRVEAMDTLSSEEHIKVIESDSHLSKPARATRAKQGAAPKEIKPVAPSRTSVRQSNASKHVIDSSKELPADSKPARSIIASDDENPSKSKLTPPASRVKAALTKLNAEEDVASSVSKTTKSSPNNTGKGKKSRSKSPAKSTTTASSSKRDNDAQHSDADSDNEGGEQDDLDPTITMFSMAVFQHQVRTRQHELIQEKLKKGRRSLNSLSARQQSDEPGKSSTVVEGPEN